MGPMGWGATGNGAVGTGSHGAVVPPGMGAWGEGETGVMGGRERGLEGLGVCG